VLQWEKLRADLCSTLRIDDDFKRASFRREESSLRPIVVVLVVAAASMLVACSYSGSNFRWTQAETDDSQAKANPAAGLVAPLRALGSAVSGKIRVIDKGDGVTLLISAINMPIGEFRVAFHENGNCSSPNGFSAGPAWAPPGRSPVALVPSLSTFGSRDGNAEREVHVAGVHTQGENGLAGRSVIIYGGSTIGEIRPGVPNNAYACGVFEPVRPIF
jgi:Cu/Zn superoxide dismutase